MIIKELQALKEVSHQVEQTLNEGIAWVNSNVVQPERRKSTLQSLKKHRRLMRRYATAIEKRPTVAVFGESQVGKSYLVSNLASIPDNDALNIIVPGTSKYIDFITQMNPKGGGKEATGVVTRFTTVNNTMSGLPPFCLRLLSQADLVKIMVDGYYSDIKDYTYQIDEEKISQLLQNLTQNKKNTPTIGLTEDEAYEIKEYILYHFRDNRLVENLSRIGFWDDMIALVPYIDSDLRWELFEVLWGQQTFFSNLFKDLSKTLKQLDFETVVYCDTNALTPNDETLLDVERLRDLYNRDTQYKIAPPVRVINQSGRSVVIKRGLLSALTLEVVAVLPPETTDFKERAFLKEADILDFPGARSRQKMAETTFSNNTNIEKVEIFLRGKVSYLFNRYNLDFEISSLLFCMHNIQSNVRGLAKLISDWIKTFHGRTPEERERRESNLQQLLLQKGINVNVERVIPLFLILTKFNIEIDGSASDIIGDPKSHDEKWRARFQANFNNFMTYDVDDKWADNWNLSDKSFKNAFLLRDPKYSNTYEVKNGREIDFRSDKIQRINDTKTSFVNHPAVKKHVRHPRQAWNEATEPGKSGINYIERYLSPTCHPIIRLELLKNLIQQTKSDAYKELDHYYKGNDIEVALKKAKRNSFRTFLALKKMPNSKFGLFLNNLSFIEDKAYSLYYKLALSPVIDDPYAIVDVVSRQISISELEVLQELGIDIHPNMTNDEIIQQFQERFGLSKEETIQELEEAGFKMEEIVEEQTDRHRSILFAEELIANWVEQLHEVISSNTKEQYGINTNIVELIISELIESKERVHLKDEIAQAVRELIDNVGINNNDGFDIIARVATRKLNDFIDTASYIQVPKEKRPKINPKADYTIFSKPLHIPQKNKLILDTQHIGVRYPGMSLFTQWTKGIEQSFLDNVYYKYSQSGDKIDTIANQRLGEILSVLKK